VARSGTALSERLRRLGRTAPLLVQSAVAAGLAYWVASELLGHEQPFFAPVAAIVGLGASYRQRGRRAVEIVVGVAIGVGVGDLVVALVGPSIFVLVLAVLVAMSIAVFLDVGALVVTQAGVQSAIVATLVADPSQGLDRWLDAVVGGGTALLIAVLSPVGPLRRPREHAVEVLRTLADLLRDAVTANRTGDVDLARRTLDRARSTEYSLGRLREATLERSDAASLSLLRRSRSRVPTVTPARRPSSTSRSATPGCSCAGRTWPWNATTPSPRRCCAWSPTSPASSTTSRPGTTTRPSNRCCAASSPRWPSGRRPSTCHRGCRGRRCSRRPARSSPTCCASRV
jgi:uncharacterized membrane protein YccC